MSEETLVMLLSAACPILALVAAAISSAVSQRERESTRWRAPSAYPHQREEPLVDPMFVPWMRPVMYNFGGYLLGVLTRLIRPYAEYSQHLESYLALAIIAYFLIRSIAYHAKRGTLLGFELENMSLWLGFVAGWSIIHGSVWWRFTEAMVPFGVASAILGGILVALIGHNRRNRHSW